MSFILVLVRSFIFSHAPVPNLLILGGSPSLPLYLDILWSEWIDTNTTSSF